MMISLVPSDHVDGIWPQVGDMLEPAVAVTHGRYTVADVLHLLRWDHMSLWIAFDLDGIHGCEVTRIIDYPSKRVLCSVFTAGQRLWEWREPMMATLLRFAADTQCTAIEGHGRDGWIKMLAPYGVRRGLTMFEKDL